MGDLSYQDVLVIVEQAGRTDRDGAERALQAVLQTLAERIHRGEAHQLAAQLPPELAPWIATTTGPEDFDVDELLRRIAEREGVDLEDAERHARAVFAALGRVVSPDELADAMAELPKDFAPLLPRGPAVEVMPADDFVLNVAERADLDDVERAWRATDAVLETLAERIAGGQVDDLVSRLAVRLHPPLERGRQASGEQPEKLSLPEFLARVVERERVTPGEAARDTRAVLLTLREAVGDDEFFDAKAQLPSEYADLLAAGR